MYGLGYETKSRDFQWDLQTNIFTRCYAKEEKNRPTEQRQRSLNGDTFRYTHSNNPLNP